jgi:glycosyltransferase involved in cell wall biosynthesis
MSVAPNQRHKAVFIANRLPWPLIDGWSRRTFHIVHQLSLEWPTKLLVLHGGDVSDVTDALAAFGEGVSIEFIRPRKYRRARGVLGSLVSGRPFHVAADWDARLARLVASAVSAHGVEVIACAGVNMASYIDLPRGSQISDVVDTHNIDSLVVDRFSSFLDDPLRRAFSKLAAPKLRTWEERVFARSALVLVCSGDEVSIVKSSTPSARVFSVPNGAQIAFSGRRVEDAPNKHPVLLFFGRLDYFPNVDAVDFFCAQILDPLRRLVPAFRLRIVGAGSDTSMRALVDRHSELELVGLVDDIGAELALADAAIVPLRSGGGTRLKILEALAAGCPVVSTTAGAEGLEVTDDLHLLLRDDAESFASAIQSVIEDSKLAQRLSQAGRALAEERYSWDGIGNSMRQLVRDTIEERLGRDDTAPRTGSPDDEQ